MNRLFRTLVPAAPVVFFAGSLLAQGTPEGQPPVVPADEREWTIYFFIPAGVEHQFRTDIDDGGRFSVTRANVGFGLRTPIMPNLELNATFNYLLDSYSFSGMGGGGGGAGLGVTDPWNDIHTLNFGAIFSANMSDDWRLFGGPVMQIARESDASWGDSVIGGGVIGSSFAITPDLRLGGGVGIVTQIEDSVRLFPVLVLDWHIAPNWRLTSQTAASGYGDTGVELVYEFGHGLEAAIGGAYRFRRFRLDDSAPVPDGVGQDTNMPMWARVSWHPNVNLTVNVYGGLVLGGRLRLEDSSGSRLGNDDYDPAGIIGASASLRF